MSYSRWGSSFWYTYPSVLPVYQLDAWDTAVFCVCGVYDFTAKELRDSMDVCLDLVESIVSENTTRPTQSEMEELRGYMNQFLAEVDERFGK